MVYEDEEPDVLDPNYDESSQVSESGRLHLFRVYSSGDLVCLFITKSWG